MSEIDNVTRERIREWQIRRLDIKEQMQVHPEKSQVLRSVLDLMDEEYADILSGSKNNQTAGPQQGGKFELSAPAAHLPSPCAGRFDLQLNLSARNPEDLRRLLEMAAYELRGQIDTIGIVGTDEKRKYPGGMSGTLGNYQFELCIDGEACHE